MVSLGVYLDKLTSLLVDVGAPKEAVPKEFIAFLGLEDVDFGKKEVEIVVGECTVVEEYREVVEKAVADGMYGRWGLVDASVNESL